MTEKEKAAAGYLFDPSADPQNAKDITRCIDLCHAYNQCTPSDFDAKRRILEQIIGRMGKNVVITAPFWCDHGYNISIGDDFYSNHNLVITDGAKVMVLQLLPLGRHGSKKGAPGVNQVLAL